jgi:hypothetical protein
MGLDYLASAPVLTIPPQQPPQFSNPQYPLPDQLANQSNQSFGGSTGFGQPTSSPSSILPSTESPVSVPTPSERSIVGRKRSRADVFEEVDEDLDDGSYVSQPAQPPKPRGEPIYGPGMTLIYPDDPIGYIAAESQTGTWADERQTHINKLRGARPAVMSRKSQMRGIGHGPRLSQSPEKENGFSPAPAVQDTADPQSNIDTTTLYLGVGWKRVAENENLQAAAAGWARFIQNHFRLADVVVQLHSEGHEAYLVQASELPGSQPLYFLFSEDLKTGRMLASTLDGVVKNLTQSPIQFEGGELQFQERTPPPPQAVNVNAMAVDGQVDSGAASAPVQEVDMML